MESGAPFRVLGKKLSVIGNHKLKAINHRPQRGHGHHLNFQSPPFYATLGSFGVGDAHPTTYQGSGFKVQGSEFNKPTCRPL
jgi:hypothetical protein